MIRFIETVPLVLTPLTPIHIGCGEDFEPTNYVIDSGVLYEFDPARLALTANERSELLRAVSQPGDKAIRAVQSFFFEKRRRCIEASRLKVPVAAGVDEWYRGRVGQVAQRESGGRTISNQLEIERTAHHPHTGRPYLPASSIKGSIRTAWLNHIDRGPVVERDPSRPPPREERSSDIEAELLGGSFSSDPFRQVKLADADGENLASRILFCVDRDKEQRLSRTGERVEKNLFVLREAIAGAQYRALSTEMRFDRLPAADKRGFTPADDKRIGGFLDLARACNGFYLPRFQSELKLLRRRFADDPWIDRVEKLLGQLQPDFQAGRSMLLRVGRHSGAECVTLDKRRWIQIKGGKQRPTYWARDATTIWLAAEREDSRAELLPFGWLLIEASPSAANDALRTWCEAESTRSPTPAVGKPEIDVAPSAQEEVWEKARLHFNRANGTLTAVGPGNAVAHALKPRSEELLAGLAPDLRAKVKANEYVRIRVRVAGGKILAIEA
ncbi:MAG: RAMP superfamily CRISPR-associated protein [Sutterellaceae bacterium]|nr:RAMP superfamily CRISPR-associated protein [Burkholderiaceae bacterium]MDW8430200.1 RAMP superfamily CRISPR-associated protein [Sutterellaceae bacterium]